MDKKIGACFPEGAKILFATAQTGVWSHSASYTVDSGGSLPTVKRMELKRIQKLHHRQYNLL
jgi:hypothetical protein